MNALNHIKIGTCDWKYDSWQGLVYSQNETRNNLQEYSKLSSTVEIDQWFWPLFKDHVIVWPRPDVMKEYAKSVPPGFVFTIKVPNTITMPHQYSEQKDSPLVPNPYFLSVDLMLRFLESVRSLYGHIGPLMFQFDHLDQKKMPNLNRFLEKFEAFVKGLPPVFQYAVEIRNPNYLKNQYFDFLAQYKLGHVFLQRNDMTSIFEVYEKFKEKLVSPVIIRLHCEEKEGIERVAENSWHEIDDPRNEELAHLTDMVRDLLKRNHDIFITVNNYYAGSASHSIKKIKNILASTA